MILRHVNLPTQSLFLSLEADHVQDLHDCIERPVQKKRGNLAKSVVTMRGHETHARLNICSSRYQIWIDAGASRVIHNVCRGFALNGESRWLGHGSHVEPPCSKSPTSMRGLMDGWWVDATDRAAPCMATQGS